jgi:sugar phosphate isomerase/epimerase
MYPNLSAGAIGVSASMQEEVAYAHKHGFRGCDVDLAAAEQFGIAQTRDLFEQNDLIMGGCGLTVEFRQDDASFRSDLSELPRWADIAQKLGCTRCSTWVPSWSDERPFDEQFKLLRGRFRECAIVLKAHGIRLGLEFLGPKTLRDDHEYEFISTLSGMLEMADAVGTGNVGLLLDAWHWYTSGGEMDQIERLTNDQVVYVHINNAPEGIAVDEQIDSVRVLPSQTSVIDLPAFLATLDKIGYDGPVTTEPFYEPLSKMAPDEAISTVKQSMVESWKAAGVSW